MLQLRNLNPWTTKPSGFCRSIQNLLRSASDDFFLLLSFSAPLLYLVLSLPTALTTQCTASDYDLQLYSQLVVKELRNQSFAIPSPLVSSFQTSFPQSEQMTRYLLKLDIDGLALESCTPLLFLKKSFQKMIT